MYAIVDVMYYTHSPKLTIIGTHGRNMSRRLQEHLKTKGILANAIGSFNLKNIGSSQKVHNATTLIFLNKDIQQLVEETLAITGKDIICLDIQEMPISNASKPLTGEGWVEYQKNVVQPEIVRQIQKHLKKLSVI